jgi:hypothetical protein
VKPHGELDAWLNEAVEYVWDHLLGEPEEPTLEEMLESARETIEDVRRRMKDAPFTDEHFERYLALSDLEADDPPPGVLEPRLGHLSDRVPSGGVFPQHRRTKMSAEKPVVWVAFVTINPGDHDEFMDFLSVHSTQEKAKTAVARWVKSSEGDDFDESLAGWVKDPNVDVEYYAGIVECTTYERIAAGDAGYFGTVDAREVDEEADGQ